MGTRSVSGGLVIRGGGCVSSFWKTQKCVTLPMTEAEYVAMSDVSRNCCFSGRFGVLRLFPEVGMPCIPVFEDNEGAI